MEGNTLNPESMIKKKLPIWYHDLYTNGIDVKARFPRDRYEKLLIRLKKSESWNKIEVKSPRNITRNELLMAHSIDYVDRFLAGNLDIKEEKRIGLTPWTARMIERTQRLMGGAIEATEHAIKNIGITGNMAGGTHHAHRDFGSGYCVFNDLAVCAIHAIDNLGLDRVAILDLDVHQGDGTATILQDRDDILTISVHCSTNFPFRKSVSDHDLPVDPNSTDEGYLKLVEKAIELCLEFEPDLVLYQAGVDGLETDSLGKLSVSRNGMKQRNEMVFTSIFEAKRIPIVVYMGGGYSKPIEHTIDAFEDLFTQAAQFNQKQ